VTRALGQVLMTEFVLPFELLAVLLLVGLLGASTSLAGRMSMPSAGRPDHFAEDR